MQANRLYFSDQHLAGNSLIEGTNTHFEHVFKNFLHEFTRENSRTYHKRLQVQIRSKRHVLPVELADIRAYDGQMYERLAFQPIESIRLMQKAVEGYLVAHQDEYTECKGQWQVVIRSDDHPIKIRAIKSQMIGKICVTSGIIISTTKPYIKANRLKVQCRNCNRVKIIDIPPGQMPFVPSTCEGQVGQGSRCPKDSFIAMPDSEVIDCQNLKIQEFPEDVPTGEVARTYSLVADRRNVSFCVPGDRVRVTGIMLVNDMKGGDQLSKGYIYVTGFQKIKERAEITYNEEEEIQFKQMSNDPSLPEKIYNSISPGIYGNEEIKKAIACMLFGGSRKHLPDNTILRGDINVLLLGDPSTGKSQFLKFVQQAASIAVYTSGKGSSAAGLTASITKDSHSGQFQIQGGALVLADGGIVCIDEFDKMKSADRVAIHEAMEQQTISVAKAGITTRLNSRTSILAAANPVFGRLDHFKEVSEQIELQTTILSRFDCIFIVHDINNPETNDKIASHILDLHQQKAIRSQETDLPFQLLKKYIKYARAKVSPRLSLIASERLQDIYVQDRRKAAQQRRLKQIYKNSVPITVRQLEAIIRISESMARMKLKQFVDVEEVEAAHYLFTVSTMKTIEGNRDLANLSDGAAQDIHRIEDQVRKRVCVGTQVSLGRLCGDFDNGNTNQALLERAINNMTRNGELQQTRGGKYVRRVR